MHNWKFKLPSINNKMGRSWKKKHKIKQKEKERNNLKKKELHIIISLKWFNKLEKINGSQMMMINEWFLFTLEVYKSIIFEILHKLSGRYFCFENRK